MLDDDIMLGHVTCRTPALQALARQSDPIILSSGDSQGIKSKQVDELREPSTSAYTGPEKGAHDRHPSDCELLENAGRICFRFL